MKNYIFFSKSNWNETPRLRHQMAGMFRAFGDSVTFFQKPTYIWQKEKSNFFEVVETDLNLVRTQHLIHHQLRITEPLRILNSIFEKSSIRSVIKDRDFEKSIIVNFNYDYFFLRDIFPVQKIVTVINDDFVAQAKLFNGAHVAESLKRTCLSSDLVLVVSYPLAKQISNWCDPKLFLPWADSQYSPPSAAGDKDSVLLWAHIDGRIDFSLLKDAAINRPEIKFFVVGPQTSEAKLELSALAKSASNFVILEPAKLDQLPLDRFFCAVIPYKKNIGDIEAVTMSNKSLQLMARGMPLVTHGMPSFYEHKAIIKSNTSNEFMEGLDFCKNNYTDLQFSIATLIDENQLKNRFEYFNKLLSKI